MSSPCIGRTRNRVSSDQKETLYSAYIQRQIPCRKTETQLVASYLRGHFQTTFADLNVIMTLGGGGSGAVTLLLTTRVEHVTACPWVWFFNQKV